MTQPGALTSRRRKRLVCIWMLGMVALYTPTTFYYALDHAALPRLETMSIVEHHSRDLYAQTVLFWTVRCGDGYITPAEALFTLGPWFFGFLFTIDLWTRLRWLPEHWGRRARPVVAAKIRGGMRDYRRWKGRNRE